MLSDPSYKEDACNSHYADEDVDTMNNNMGKIVCFLITIIHYLHK